MKHPLIILLTSIFFILACKNKSQDYYQKLPRQIAVVDPLCKTPQKINVYRDQVYDLCGYQNAGKGDPYNLFDENQYVDPRSENKSADNYIPQTNPQPTANQAIYFPADKGNRIVTDLEVPYKLSEAYIYDKSSNSDSVWIYTGNMLHWKLKAAFVTSEGAGWKKFSLNDSAQYVMIRFSSYKTDITEMVLYGCPYQPLPARPSDKYNGPRFPKKMMKDFLGVNYFNEVDPKWIKPFHYSRFYAFAVDYDDDKSEYPNNKYNMLHNAHWNQDIRDYGFFIQDIIKQNGGNFWMSMNGKPAWMDNEKYNNLRPVTHEDMNPENPLSYARHGNMMFNIAGYFGHSKIDTNLFSLSFSLHDWGRNMMSLYENGNEDDATWVGSKYCNPIEYFAESSADYDGHESALGKKIGIKNADASAKLMTSGMIQLDTNRVRVYKFLCNTMRTDKKFVWDGGIQYHHYSTTGKHGITPEEDSLRMRLTKVREATYRIQPDVECFLGENGYDKSQNSRQSVPMLPNLSEEACQGIFILRSINATAFSGFDAYILYWLRDGAGKEDNRVYLTSGVFREDEHGMTPLPAWYHISTFVNVLGNYIADEVVNENGNVWIYKYRNKLSPDSVAYFVYSPTHDGTKAANYPLKIGSATDDNASEVYFDDASETGKISNKKIVNGSVVINVEERPKIILVKEKR